MKKLLVVVATACLVLGSEHAWAQDRVVSGTVTSSAGSPLAGVVVTVKGTNVRAVTDENGRYSISVPGGAQRLVFSGQAVTTEEAAIAGNTVNVSLASQALALEGLVVTALGITQQEKAVGTAVQSVRGEELTEARETNIVNALSGKVSGLQVTSAGPQGGSSRVVIRGASSIKGNNQPLFIIDGVPIDNSAPTNPISRTQPDRVGYGGYDYGNAAADINPNDIESITVLKGPNAAALYGSRAANGAIVITTKSGRNARGLGITVTQNVSFEDPLRLPEYQNEFGQGAKGAFAYVDGAGGGINDGVDESWGPRCDGRLIPQFYSGGQAVPFNCYPDNVRNFFDTGRTLTTNVALATSSDRANVRLSLTNMDQNGMYPGNELNRLTGALNGGVSLTDKLRADASVQYIATDGQNRPGTGYDASNVMEQFVWFGRSVDVSRLKGQFYDEDGNQYNWNHNYHNSPYWLALVNENFDERDRVIGNVQVNYQFTPWLNAMVRSGTDWYRDYRRRHYAPGTIAMTASPETGGFEEENIFTQETNTDFLLTANRDLGTAVGLTFNFGGNRRVYDFRYNEESAYDLVVPAIYNITNSSTRPTLFAESREKQINSLYGQAQFAFNNFWFVDVTGRNDWSSTLPAGNNSYFYPSISSSFVFTDAFPSFAGNLLSFGKLRGSWARVGNDADPYQTSLVYTAGTPFGTIPRYAVPNAIPNRDLKPEETTSWEAGAELRFIDDRLGLDVTYYDQSTANQILSATVSGASGFQERVLNAGTISNRGVEVQLSATPVRLDNGFEWDVTVNYARNKNRVEELYGDLQAVSLNGTGYWGLIVQARKDEPYGALYGTAFARDAQNRIIVDEDGFPTTMDAPQVLGSYTPDWSGSLGSTLRFRNLDFSFLFDTKQGGEIFSVTNMFGMYAGILKESVEGRCDFPAADGGNTCATNGYLFQGVTANGQPNTTRVDPKILQDVLFQLHEAWIYDASFVKLREIKLGYNVPQSLSGRFGISGMNVSLVGRNLALWTDAPHIDPETAFTAGNQQGLEFGQLPTARSIGFNVTVTP